MNPEQQSKFKHFSKKLLQSGLIILFIIMAFGSCFPEKAKESCFDNKNAETILHDGLMREYILYIPESYDGSREVPLLFNFHGFGGSAEDFMTYADMRPIAEKDTFILVYPQGSCLDGYAHWNASLPSPENKSNADDLGFISELLDKLLSNYNIDAERVYACGFSNGAMFSYALSCYRSELFAAVGSVSGTMLEIGGNCTPEHPMPVIEFHGTNDEVIPYTGSNDYASVEEVLEYWKAFNQTDEAIVTNITDNNGNSIQHYVFTNGNNKVSVEHYKVEGGNHSWFNINDQGSSTGELIWHFVSKYDLNGLRQ